MPAAFGYTHCLFDWDQRSMDTDVSRKAVASGLVQPQASTQQQQSGLGENRLQSLQVQYMLLVWLVFTPC